MGMNIYKAINSIMDEIPAIGKSQKNAQQGFMYRGIDVVMNVLQPLLSKHKVFAVPEVLEHIREERQTKSGGNLIYSICKIKYTFYADDGSNVSAVVVGEGMDSGDKATNKAMAIAFKYACFQVFCIPTEEMKDPDGETPEPSKPKAQEPIKAPIKAEPKKVEADTPKVAKEQKPPAVPVCVDCGATIKEWTSAKNRYFSPDAMAELAVLKFGRKLCADCITKQPKE